MIACRNSTKYNIYTYIYQVQQVTITQLRPENEHQNLLYLRLFYFPFTGSVGITEQLQTILLYALNIPSLHLHTVHRIFLCNFVPQSTYILYRAMSKNNSKTPNQKKNPQFFFFYQVTMEFIIFLQHVISMIYYFHELG